LKSSRGADKSLGRPTFLSVAFFRSRGQAVVRWGQTRRIGWVIKTLEAQVCQALLGCKCPVSLSLHGRAKDLPALLYWAYQLPVKKWDNLRTRRHEAESFLKNKENKNKAKDLPAPLYWAYQLPVKKWDNLRTRTHLTNSTKRSHS
jgi:hypothetical protein